MPVPTGRLAAVAAVASLAVLGFAPPWGLLTVDGALVLLALVDWWLAARPAALRVERDWPGTLRLDARSTVTWRVTNPTGRPVHVALADELAPSLRAGHRRARLRVPAHASAAAATSISPSRRGRFAPGGVTLRVDGPLRLASRQRWVALPGVLRVHPPFRSRAEAELRIERARLLDVGLRSVRGRGGGTEFDALREYEVDDDSRRIDWAATARSGGRAIVRTYRAERNQAVISMLDTGRTMAGLVGGVPRLDHALDAVMMLTAVASRLGDRAGLVAFDAAVRAIVPPTHGRGQLAAVTDAIYALEPALLESDYRSAFVQTLARFRRRSMLVVFTELAEQATAESLLPALPLVVRDHVVVVAAVRDPAVVRWATSPPGDAAGAYRAAAATGALEERRRTVARLRSLGVTVVDELPGRMAPALADAYLKVKATGRL